MFALRTPTLLPKLSVPALLIVQVFTRVIVTLNVVVVVVACETPADSRRQAAVSGASRQRRSRGFEAAYIIYLPRL
jgi:hypothetical protein